jgi:hypothetical protein
MTLGSLAGTWERENQSELKSVPAVSGNQKVEKDKHLSG